MERWHGDRERSYEGSNLPAAHLWMEQSSGGRNWFPGDIWFRLKCLLTVCKKVLIILKYVFDFHNEYSHAQV